MNRFRIYGGVMLSMIFWAFSFIWFKVANESFPPVTIVFIRLILAVIILTAYLTVKGKFQKIKKEDRKLFLLLAVFEPFFYFLGESNGLTYVSSTTGSVIISTIPVIAALGAWLFFGEKLRALNYAGIILSFVGIIVFVIGPGGKLSFNVTGLLLLGLAVISAVGYNLTLSRLVGSYSPVFIVHVQNIIGAVLFLPVFLLTDLRNFIDSTHTLRSYIPIFELSLFASCGAFILFAFSVRKMGISKANAFTNCIPVFTAIFSFFIMGEKLTGQNLAGMAIVITGLYLSQSDKKKRDIDDALILTGKTA
jgi:drug/metabolite transporter (DMT)-like permease